MGNAVEDAAVQWLLQYMPEAVDTRHIHGAPADLEWNGRVIEVKAYSQANAARGAAVWLEPRQHDAALEDERFELWLIENVAAGPDAMRLTVLAGDQLAGLIATAKERHYWEMPLPVAQHDHAPHWTGGSPESRLPDAQRPPRGR